MMNKLFDYYVRDMKNWMESIEHDLSELYEDADKINRLIIKKKHILPQYYELSYCLL